MKRLAVSCLLGLAFLPGCGSGESAHEAVHQYHAVLHPEPMPHRGTAATIVIKNCEQGSDQCLRGQLKHELRKMERQFKHEVVLAERKERDR
jgi:hypothetical protein